jgi:hypothetical protein
LSLHVITQDKKYSEFLLKNGANVNIVSQGYTPLLYLARFVTGYTLSIACERFYKTMLHLLKLFLDYGADLDVLSPTNQTAIEILQSAPLTLPPIWMDQAMVLLKRKEKENIAKVYIKFRN